MRTIAAVAGILCVLSVPLPSAADAPDARAAARATRDEARPLQRLTVRHAVEREAALLALTMNSTAMFTVQPQASRDSGWMRRHPVLFGALVGAGAGAVSSIPRWTELYCAGGGDEDCLFHGGGGVLFGAGAGAGIGAVIGVLVGR
jgi:hypothetical protein